MLTSVPTSTVGAVITPPELTAKPLSVTSDQLNVGVATCVAVVVQVTVEPVLK